ncbi:uncharacterized protein LOC128885996 isoform X2 [Hylaeus anthracinus]|uniref:uncharacterized protein LOC128885996 isoform X2 n=1 Tax=Hylaeus anthracinus TaxID=313031 RepID=UPI0023BA08C1|nr:uncharacterized protein LOC128885996 isoform X2 [Hylaeus anthracinus]
MSTSKSTELTPTPTPTTTTTETTMGFKDKQKALETLKALDGRDISYQYHVIVSFVSRTKRTLQITKDEEKLTNLREALKVFEDWLTDYKEKNRGKENLAYLPIETVNAFRILARKYDVLDEEFFEVYKKEKGDYKSLRLVKFSNGKITWDIERNRRLKEIIDKIKETHAQWYETDVGDFRGLPTKEHVRCVMLGYSPDPSKLKKLISRVKEKFGSEACEKTVADADEKEPGENKPAKRSRESWTSSTSSESEDGEPDKKVAKRSVRRESSEANGEKNPREESMV